MNKTTTKCPGCGGVLSLCPRGGRVRPAADAFFSHLILSKKCAAELYELGHCVIVDGVAVVSDSIYARRQECGKIVVQGVSRQGKLVHLEDCDSLIAASKIAEEYRNQPRVNPAVSGWRGN